MKTKIIIFNICAILILIIISIFFYISKIPRAHYNFVDSMALIGFIYIAIGMLGIAFESNVFNTIIYSFSLTKVNLERFFGHFVGAKISKNQKYYRSVVDTCKENNLLVRHKFSYKFISIFNVGLFFNLIQIINYSITS